ncbi:MAG: PEP/pyruvate-binding domain-containing protein [Acidobacteriota bacterium]
MAEGRGQISRYGMRTEQFSALMPYRVQQVLLVASRYDSFLLEEEGQLAELLAREYRNLELHIRHVPRFVTAESGKAALELPATIPLDMVVTTTRLPDMPLAAFSQRLKSAYPGLPLGVLVPHAWDMPRLAGLRESGLADWVFLWQGDAKVLLAMIEQEEDRRNADHDVLVGGVRVIIVVDDDVRFQSFLLPHLYAEVTQQTARLMAEGLNLSHRLLRLQARPKVLLATSFEEAQALFERYGEQALAVIADVSFPRGGQLNETAGFGWADLCREADPDLAVLLQSSDPVHVHRAARSGVAFVHKESGSYVAELRRFLLESCSFGDFVFRQPGKAEVGRARNLRELLAELGRVPEASIEYHAAHNHFSRWFAARTEFELAAMVRPRRVSEFPSIARLRSYLVRTVEGYLREIQRNVIADFDLERYDDFVAFAKVGGSALGGKGRGLAFVQRLLAEERPDLHGAEVAVPQTLVLAADVFEGYLETNNLRHLIGEAHGLSDAEVLDAFRQGRFDRPMRAQLAAFLQVVRDPLAVRSSSVLEDSPYQPFAGVYATVMLPNNHPSLDVRLAQMLEAIKVVYASTYMKAARDYFETTPHRLEEERMGVLLQRLVGRRHGDRFHPLLSGVASSYNFYPFRDMNPEDGVAMIALGLGKAVVEGFEALRFCPRYPQVLPQFSSVKDILKNAQRRFWSLDMTTMDLIPGLPVDSNLVQLDVRDGLDDPAAAQIASTYIRANDSIVDGIARGGTPLVTFARLLKGRGFPLGDVLSWLLQVTQRGMGMPVEIEFALDLVPDAGDQVLSVLQVRPMVVELAGTAANLASLPQERIVAQSNGALGHGRSEPLHDVVVVLPDLDRSRTPEVVVALERLNRELREARRPYLLIGPGRWGSRDPWLGIPVVWAQISGARAIVEVDFADLDVEPSQGSHFFHVLTSFGIPYLPVHQRHGQGHVNWGWLASRPAERELLDGKLRHLRLTAPLGVILDGATRAGVVVAGEG